MYHINRYSSRVGGGASDSSVPQASIDTDLAGSVHGRVHARLAFLIGEHNCFVRSDVRVPVLCRVCLIARAADGLTHNGKSFLILGPPSCIYTYVYDPIYTILNYCIYIYIKLLYIQ